MLLTIPGVCAIVVLLAAARFALVRLTCGAHVTSDGDSYLKVARGEVAESPFHIRWLLPTVCGDKLQRWEIVNLIAHLLCGPLLVIYLSQWGFTAAQCLAGGALWVGLPGISVLAAWCPVLTDQVAHMLALAIAVAIGTGSPPGLIVAAMLALTAGCVHETIPVWAAVISWHPLPLVGLVTSWISWWERRAKGTPRKSIHSFKVLAKRGATTFFKPRWVLVPWGVCLAAFASNDLQVYTALFLGYACLLLAGGLQRIYMKGYPVVIAGALSVLPNDPGVLMALCVAHWFVMAWDPKPAPGCPLPGL